MNTKNRLTNFFAVVALGTGISMFTPTADAAPRDRDVREARKEVKNQRKDLKKAKREVRKDVKQGHREKRRDNTWNNSSNNRYKNGSSANRYNSKNRYNSGNYNQNRNSTYHSFTGIVTKVKRNGEFELRVGNQVFDVYTHNLPRGLDKGDTVRVYGVRSGQNDLRNASVSIIRNR